ncbi:MAG: magnesium protoporphyrin IX methyltransferase [Pseudomonadota bacterium]
MASVTLPLERATQKTPGESYAKKRDALEHYFDRTAADAWRALTSDEKVSRIRATVRAGREDMRRRIMARLGENLSGRHLLDAGCGTGALSLEAARRGGTVTAIDVSPTMVDIARERAGDGEAEDVAAAVTFRAGDMVNEAKGPFDHVVAMDSLIHYELSDILSALTTWAPLVTRSIVFTFAPRTPALTLKHAVGALFPRGQRAPEIAPVGERKLRNALGAEPDLKSFALAHTERVSSGFYTSQLVELSRR